MTREAVQVVNGHGYLDVLGAAGNTKRKETAQTARGGEGREVKTIGTHSIAAKKENSLTFLF